MNIDLRAEGIPESLLPLLPQRIREPLKRFGCELAISRIEEIRIRRERCVCLTSCGENYRLNLYCTNDEIDDMVVRMCEGSLYAHSETIKKGYVSLKNGIRVGICGRASYDTDGISGVSEVSSVSIRIPHPAPDGVGKELCDIVRQRNTDGGLLIYSPPGEGKTTLLRSISRILSGGRYPMRVALVDTRGELAYSLDRRDLCLDVLSGYSKADGIEIAARTLSAQVIVCDEIGSFEEAESVAYAHNCGILLIASAHASVIEELIRKPAIALMNEYGVFSQFVLIKRRIGVFDFEYKIDGREEIRDKYGISKNHWCAYLDDSRRRTFG